MVATENVATFHTPNAHNPGQSFFTSELYSSDVILPLAINWNQYVVSVISSNQMNPEFLIQLLVALANFFATALGRQGHLRMPYPYGLDKCIEQYA